MFSAATDTILPLMPSLRPQRGRSDGAAGATLMRSANQFNKRAPPRNGRTRQRRRVEDEGQTQRREANALTSRGAARNARTYTGGNGHVSREGRSGNRSIVRVGGDSSKLHPEITATPRTGAGWRGRPHADTLARWRRLAQSGVAAHKPRALAGTPPRPTPPSPHPQHPNEAPRNGRIRVPCVIRGASAAKRVPPWQDLRVMHSRKAICGAFRIHGAISCQSQLVLDARRRYVAREGRFSRPGRLRGCMERKKCHGLPPGNASRRNPAIAERPGTHRGVTEPGSTAQTKRQPIQQRATTRPRNRENLLVPSAEKRRRKHARVLWRS